jgi:hypothetical protein
LSIESLRSTESPSSKQANVLGYRFFLLPRLVRPPLGFGGLASRRPAAAPITPQTRADSAGEVEEEEGECVGPVRRLEWPDDAFLSTLTHPAARRV